MTQATEPNRQTRWLSEDLTQLVAKYQPHEVYDLVIVGSGYGGSMAAAQLAGARIAVEGGPPRSASVCVLERGQEYLPGSFGSNMADLGAYIWPATGKTSSSYQSTGGLFDFRLGADVNALVASGLGGGSLINAGVMLKPDFGAFNSHLPNKVQSELQSLFDEVKDLLGARRAGADNTITQHCSQRQGLNLAKTVLMRSIAQARTDCTFQPAPITVAMDDVRNAFGVKLPECTLCGDCATGCNVGAKESLDTNLLVEAKASDAEIYTGASVWRLERAEHDGSPDKVWVLDVVYTDPRLQERMQWNGQAPGEPLRLRAHKVIVAAGTYGSTELLLRSRTQSGLSFSDCLGLRFSGNGDNLGALYKARTTAHSVAKPNTPITSPPSRMVGPTITGLLKFPATDKRRGFYVQEFSTPAPLRMLFQEIVLSVNALKQLPECNVAGKRQVSATDPLAVDDGELERSMVVGLIGHDQADGRMVLESDERDAGAHNWRGPSRYRTGRIRVVWPQARYDRELDQAFSDAGIAVAAHVEKDGGLLRNPITYPLPTKLEMVLDKSRGPVLTVHPLGGCPMGASETDGVVNEYGAVFKAAATRYLKAPDAADQWQGTLLVLDGSIVPTSLGANPSLTIAALSLRAARHWSHTWPDWVAKDRDDRRSLAWIQTHPRPIYRKPQDCVNTAPVATKMQLIERQRGAISRQWVAELTMGFESQAMKVLKQPPLKIATDAALRKEFPYMNRLRIFHRKDWDDPRLNLATADDATREAHAVFTADMHGHLEYFYRDSASNFCKAWRGFWSYVGNRGLRDGLRAIKAWASRRPGEQAATEQTFGELIRTTLNIAAHAGEVRRLNYRMVLANVQHGPKWDSRVLEGPRAGDQIWGEKLFTYRRRSNPWNQLLFMQITKMRLADFSLRGQGPEMEVDARYFATQAVPLMRITQQDNQINARADIASFLTLFARVVLDTHFWSFRQPDDSPDTTPQRLPAAVEGLPVPQVVELALRHSVPNYGGPVYARLTRYAPDPAHRVKGPIPPCPLVLIHGFSASGTSYAHPSLQPGMAQHFWDQGYDVWLLDLRTSPDLPCAAFSWSFEDVAWSDIPVAIDYVTRKVQQEQGLAVPPQVDVFAHCIGAVMFSMALLTDQGSPAFAAYSSLDHACNAFDTDGTLFYKEEVERLPGHIRKVVLSQKSFALDYSDANVLRSFLMRYFRRLLGNGRYKFRPDGPETLKDKLLDLILSAVPYPKAEYDRENPPFWKFWRMVPWARTRHRMDALYQHTFNPNNLSDQLLEHIDDQFGPVNINTLAQILHLARKKVVTTTEGKNLFVSGDNLQNRWPKQGTLHIYNDDNKMVGRSTPELTRQWMAANGVPFETRCVPGMAHQDGLIGKDRSQTFGAVQQFLQAPPTQGGAPMQDWLLQAPWTGPRITRGASVGIWVGGDPGCAQTKILVLPVQRVDSSLLLALPQPQPTYLQTEDVFSTTNVIPPALQGFAATTVSANPPPSVQAQIDVCHLLGALGTPAPGVVGYVVLACIQRSGDARVDSASITTLFADLPQELLQSCFVDKATVSPSAAEPTRFVVASCKYPNGVFDVLPAAWALQEIEKQQAAGTVREMLMLGDQIYADATAGLLDPSRIDDRYQRPYEDLYRIPALRNLMRSIPIRMMLDDHEIVENWEPGGNPREDYWFSQGLAAYWRYQRPGEQSFTQAGAALAPLHGAYTVCGFPLYMADTRTERTLRNAQTPNAAIMSETQMNAIHGWMLANQASTADTQRPLFVACPAMILPRPLALHGHLDDRLLSDSWAGYPASMDALLGFMAQERIRGVVFLSGDEHLGNCAEFTLRDGAGKVLSTGYSIHVPGLYAPIPFANAVPEKFASNEIFPVTYAGIQYQCKVRSHAAAPGNGFVSIEVRRDGTRFHVVAETHQVSGSGVAIATASHVLAISPTALAHSVVS